MAPWGSARWVPLATLILAISPARAAEGAHRSASAGVQGRWVTGYYAYWQTHLYSLEKVD